MKILLELDSILDGKEMLDEVKSMFLTQKAGIIFVVGDKTFPLRFLENASEKNINSSGYVVANYSLFSVLK